MVDVWLKQIDRSSLSDVNKKVIETAFPGFLSPTQYWDKVRRLAKENPAVDVIPVPINDGQTQGQGRRFAGDYTLPFGRYYTLARDETGDDGGTLVAELYAYYEPEAAGPILVRDASFLDAVTAGGFLYAEGEPASRALKVRLYKPGAVLPVLPDYLETFNEPLSFMIPLSVHHRRVAALDLRDPKIADQFASFMSRCGKGDGEFPYFKRRPAVDRFSDILATMLAQERGGGVFCKIAGRILREVGCPSLIYPSARADPGVTVRDGSVASWQGWNLVNYNNATPSRYIYDVDRSNYWDPMVGEYIRGTCSQWPRQICPLSRRRIVVSFGTKT